MSGRRPPRRRRAAPSEWGRRAFAAALLGGLVLAAGCGDRAERGTERAGPEEEAPPAPDTVEAGYLPGADGLRIHYQVVGSGPDTAVVVHGGPGAGIGSVLPDVAPLAGEGLTLIFYDQRGGGLSELPSDTTLLHARYFVADLEAVRRHFGLDRLKLFTHSFGAILAARYANRHPSRVDRIVMHGATGPVRADAARAARAARARVVSSPDTALSNRATALLRSLLSGTAEDPVAACREYEAIGGRLAEARGEAVTWRGSTCDMPADAIRYYYRYTAQLAPRSFGDWDFTDALQDLDAPVLVVWGARDTTGVALQEAWVDAAPNGRLLLVPGAGKSAISDRPQLVVPAVGAFLRAE